MVKGEAMRKALLIFAGALLLLGCTQDLGFQTAEPAALDFDVKRGEVVPLRGCYSAECRIMATAVKDNYRRSNEEPRVLLIYDGEKDVALINGEDVGEGPIAPSHSSSKLWSIVIISYTVNQENNPSRTGECVDIITSGLERRQETGRDKVGQWLRSCNYEFPGSKSRDAYLRTPEDDDDEPLKDRRKSSVENQIPRTELNEDRIVIRVMRNGSMTRYIYPRYEHVKFFRNRRDNRAYPIAGKNITAVRTLYGAVTEGSGCLEYVTSTGQRRRLYCWP